MSTLSTATFPWWAATIKLVHPSSIPDVEIASTSAEWRIKACTAPGVPCLDAWISGERPPELMRLTEAPPRHSSSMTEVWPYSAAM